MNYETLLVFCIASGLFGAALGLLLARVFIRHCRIDCTPSAPSCFGTFISGQVAAERDCFTCLHEQACRRVTETRVDIGAVVRGFEEDK